LLSHGHFDHVASAAAVADSYRAACWIHPADRPWLTDPLAALTADFRPLVAGYLGEVEAREPATMLPADSERLELAGMDFQLLSAPGHTPGSTLIRTSYPDGDRRRDLVFTGDVLFEGTIGRTDLPGGDPAAMERTLSSTLEVLADDAVVLPGHGRQTTIGRERSTNPFLRQRGGSPSQPD
jgi:glyoxylase-like metal-dependent hydrolase (beta-lactamase superfamily II)